MTQSSKSVFLSYASEDAGAAKRICDALHGAGIEVWLDQSELRGGDAWDQKIRQQIRDCALFIPIISAHTQERPEGYFRLEWKLAVDRSHLMAAEKAFLVPVVVDATTEPEALVPAQFREVQWTRIEAEEVPPAFVDRITALLHQRVAPRVGSPTGEVQSTRAGRPLVFAIALSVTALAAIAIATAIRGYLLSAKPVRNVEAGTAIASVTTTPAAVPEKSIAVLPFVDMSEKHDQEYFSDGLAEELLNLLSQVQGLRVPSRTSSFSFKGRSDDLTAIASQLRVAHVLEGSVRKAGKTIRVTAQLIRASDGYHIWSKTFDREYRDIFKIQDEIARAVVESLQTTLRAADRPARGTTSPEAYNLLLQANYFAQHTTPENLRRSVELAKQALAVDPEYSDAWARLSIDYRAMGGGDIPELRSFAMAREAASRAVALAPDRAKGHAALAYVLIDTGEFGSARREIEAEKRDESRPSKISNAEGILECALGHWQRAIEIYEAGVREDPLNPVIAINLGNSYYGAGRYSDAEAAFRHLLAISPGTTGGQAVLAMTVLMQGRAADALAEAQREADDSARLQATSAALDALGRHAEAETSLRLMIDRYGKSEPVSVAETLAMLGRHDAAFEWLEKARRAASPAVFGIKGSPQLQSLRNDVRWARLVRELNLPD